MDEPKLCPLCGSKAQRVNMLIDDRISHKAGAACSNSGCSMHQPFYLHEWQSRPLEDALRQQLEEERNYKNGYETSLLIIDEKNIEIDALRQALAWAKDLLVRLEIATNLRKSNYEMPLHAFNAVHAEVIKSQAEIARLEGGK